MGKLPKHIDARRTQDRAHQRREALKSTLQIVFSAISMLLGAASLALSVVQVLN